MNDFENKKSKAVEAMLAARVSRKEKGLKTIKRNRLEMWEDNKFSLRKSVDAKCFDCSCQQVEEVRHCTVTSCPLWYVRPFQVKES